jgi:hypothetical protein
MFGLVDQMQLFQAKKNRVDTSSLSLLGNYCFLQSKYNAKLSMERLMRRADSVLRFCQQNNRKMYTEFRKAHIEAMSAPLSEKTATDEERTHIGFGYFSVLA